MVAKSIYAMMATCIISSFAQANSLLQKVTTERNNDAFITTLLFDTPVDQSTVIVEYINQTIQVDIKNAAYDKKKHLHKSDVIKEIKSVYTYQAEDDVLRSRIIYNKPQLAGDLEPYTHLLTKNNELQIIIDKKGEYIAKLNRAKIPDMPPTDLNAEVDKALRLPEKIKAEAIVAKELAMAAKTKAKNANKVVKNSADKIGVAESFELPESEIPVFTKTSAAKAADTGMPYGRLMFSFLIIIALSVGMGFFAKWWKTRSSKSLDNNKISVLTQHYLAPKRSLAIIRVAGEYILIGVTEQNISMIKTLSLIDDEYPNVDSQDSFSESLVDMSELNNTASPAPASQTQMAKSKDSVDEFAFGSVKDVVAKKLSQMRSI